MKRIVYLILLTIILSGSNAFSQNLVPGVYQDQRNNDALPKGLKISASFAFKPPAPGSGNQPELLISFHLDGNQKREYALILFEQEKFNYTELQDGLRSVLDYSGIGSSVSSFKRPFTPTRNIENVFFEYPARYVSKQPYGKKFYNIFTRKSQIENFTISDLQGLMVSDRTFSYLFLVARVSGNRAIFENYAGPYRFTIPAEVINEMSVYLKPKAPPAELPPAQAVIEKPVEEQKVPEEKAGEEKLPEEAAEAPPPTPPVVREPSRQPARTRDNCEEFKKQYEKDKAALETRRRSIERELDAEFPKFTNEMERCTRMVNATDCWDRLNTDFEKWLKDKTTLMNRFDRDVDNKNSLIETHNSQATDDCKVTEISKLRQSYRKKFNETALEIGRQVINLDAMTVTVNFLRDRISGLSSIVSRFANDFNQLDSEIVRFSPDKREAVNFTIKKQKQFKENLEKFALEKQDIEKNIELLRTDAAGVYEKNNTERRPFNSQVFDEFSGLGSIILILDGINPSRRQSQILNWPAQRPDYTSYIVGLFALLILVFGAFVFVKMQLNKRKRMQKNYKFSGSKQQGYGAIDRQQHISRSGSIPAGMDDIEVVEEESVAEKGRGLEHVRQYHGGQYYEIDLKKQWDDTTVRKIYIHRDCIIKTYRYFEDLQLSYSNPDDIDEHGGFLIGRWDINPFNENQYDLSVEDFVMPGKDAKFTKYNIEFGNEIAQNLERTLANYADKGFECVMTAWIHSHPGHSIFLSKFDLNVQDQLRDPGHEKRTVAFVIEPRTERWELGIFSFRHNNEMNNSDKMKEMFYFDDLYNWAISEASNNLPEQYFQKSFPNNDTIVVKNVGLSNQFILAMKRFIEDYQLTRPDQFTKIILGQRIPVANERYNYIFESLYDEEAEKHEEEQKNQMCGLLIINIKNFSESQLQEYLLNLNLDDSIDLLLVYSIAEQGFTLYSKAGGTTLADFLSEPVLFSMKDVIFFKNR
jgi:proteasome lid subunit RPN8/RPN11